MRTAQPLLCQQQAKTAAWAIRWPAPCQGESVRRPGRATRCQGGRAARRGVVLLIVLGILTLFMLIAVTYVMTAEAEYRGAKVAARYEQSGDSPDALLRQAMLQIARGARNPRSAIGPYSLLEGIYGEQHSVRGVIPITSVGVNSAEYPVNPLIVPADPNGPPQTHDRVGRAPDRPAAEAVSQGASRGQLIELCNLGSYGLDRLPGVGGVDDSGGGMQGIIDDSGEYGAGDDVPLHLHRFPSDSPDQAVPPQASQEGFFAGRVITMLDGDCAMESARIVRWFFDRTSSPPMWKMWIRPFGNGMLPKPGDQYVINGRAYSGAGKGYNPDPAANGENTLTDADGMPLAHVINPSDPQLRRYLDGTFGVPTADMNVDYTAPDLNNVLLAARVYNPSLGRWQVRMPSLHRPALVNYWTNRMGVSDWSQLPVALRRRIIIRPDPADHVFHDLDGNGTWSAAGPWVDLNGNGVPDSGEFSNFNYADPEYSGNIYFNAINGPWDVDNDNDGEPDSVWVDLGMPVQVMPDGRRFKPLFAILCIDLDGRLNLNAHGVSWHYAWANPQDPYNTSFQPTMPPTTSYEITSEAIVRGLKRSHRNQISLGIGGPDFNVDEPLFEFPYHGGAYAGGSGWVNKSSANSATGMGFGPAEISLAPLYAAPSVEAEQTGGTQQRIRRKNRYRWLLEGRYEELTETITPPTGPTDPGNLRLPAYEGRYGESHLVDITLPGKSASGGLSLPRAGMTARGTKETGDDNFPPAPMAHVHGSNSRLFRGNKFTEQGYGSPPDTSGRALVGLDHRGLPVWGHLPLRDDLLDDPYEINLSHDAQRFTFDYGPDGIPGTADDRPNKVVSIDNPFTPTELEHILRFRDQDQVIDERFPNRFSKVIGTVSENFSHRVTTEQWDLPVPNMVPPPDVRRGLGLLGITPINLSIADFLRGKILEVNRLHNSSVSNLPAAVAAMTSTSPDPANPHARYARVISPDLLMGLRMDINRPLGNNWDDNNNGVVDEPSEFNFNLAGIQGKEPLWQGSSTQEAMSDLNGDGVIDVHDTRARQELAKHLYLLMMMVTDEQYGSAAVTIEPLLSNAPNRRDRERLRAYRIAQWAINVVDFRDSDSIMTPFEFDIFPFEDDDTHLPEYSPNGTGPFRIPGTWDVDGIVGEGSLDDNVQPAPGRAPYRGLVWGMEYPELLITEALATHDKGLADTDQAVMPPNQEDKKTGTMGDDPDDIDHDWDQLDHPEGSLFVELYCTGQATNYSGGGAASADKLAGLPRELYNTTSSVNERFPAGITRQVFGALDLGRMVGEGSQRVPVWRIAISNVHKGQDVGQPTVREMLYDNSHNRYRPQTLTLQPEAMNLLDPNDTTLNVGIERIVWFCNPVNSTTPQLIKDFIENNSMIPPEDKPKIYTGRRTASGSPDTHLQLVPGRYAVVGPSRPASNDASRHVTTLGYVRSSASGALNFTPQKIDLQTEDRPFAMVTGGTTYPNVNTIKNPLGIPVAKVLDDNFAGKQSVSGFERVQGLNISEPLEGYPMEYDASGAQSVADTNGITHHRRYPEIKDHAADSTGGAPLMQHQMLQPGTYLDVRTLFLQRLADPTIAWNPLPGQPGHRPTVRVNPYITIDWMPVDLTIFNGALVYNNQIQRAERRPTGGPTLAGWPAATPDPAPALPAMPPSPRNYWRREPGSSTSVHQAFRTETRERGPRNTGASAWPTDEMPLWSAISEDPRVTTPVGSPAATPPDFPSPLTQQSHFEAGMFRHRFEHTLGYLNRHYGQPLTNSDLGDGNVHPHARQDYIGSPRRPFPWLTWNNRPYANVMELLLVPAASPQRLGVEFSYRTATPQAGMGSEYTGTASPVYWGTWSNTAPGANQDPWRHATYPPPAGPTFGHMLNFFASGPANQQTAGSHYSRLFELVHVPSRYSGTEEILTGDSFKPVLGQGASYQMPSLTPFYAPFNRVSRFRDPGRININTLFDTAGDSIWTGVTNYAPGHSTTWDNIRRTRGDFASELPNQQLFDSDLPEMFVNPFRSYMGEYRVSVPQQRNVGGAGGDPYLRSDASLLRRGNPELGNSLPLLAMDGWTAGADDYRNSNRNPYFRYKPLTKVGGMLTNRSNVYAMWVTMGMFEVEEIDPATYQNPAGAYAAALANPDGYKLVRELGWGSGGTRRFRAFGVFDRTIPVGFERGENLNVHKGFLINRNID